MSIYRVKNYIKGAFYHIYNRGVNKEEIFFYEDDFSRFMYRLEKHIVGDDKRIKNHHGNIKILAFCLLENHFHLLVQNDNERGIEKFMKSLCTSHSKYMNTKYSRVGHLFQERYQAVLIKSDEQLITTSRYIHLNPEDRLESPLSYPYSSLKYYISDQRPSWIHRSPILNYFSLDQDKALIKYMEFIRQS